MKLFVASVALIGTAVITTGADTPPPVSYFSHGKVAEVCAKSGTLLTAPDVRVLCTHRSEPDRAEIHEKTTHVFSIVDGTAVMVTGGTLVDSKMTGPGEMRGSSIEGGKAQQLSKGDVIVIPAGTPHWWKEVQSMSYYGVNLLKP